MKTKHSILLEMTLYTVEHKLIKLHGDMKVRSVRMLSAYLQLPSLK